MARRITMAWWATGLLGLLVAACALGQLGYQDTPMLPGGQWHVHDGTRPQPPVIDAGLPSTNDQVGKAPSDAVVLFDGSNLDRWRNDKGATPAWKIEDGVLVCAKGGGQITTRDTFGDCQVHLEWAAPTPPSGSGQGRGNSGLFFCGRYEIQILDCYQSQTYPDGQTAALYGQFPPLVNACRPPGQWQSYDVIWTAPKFANNQLVAPAAVTMLHNGVLVHNHTALLGGTSHRGLAKYHPHDPVGPLALQDHGNPVRFRNIWVRPIKAYDQP
ncbi:MAG: DUF1080 domain-containing protein [Fimbriimonadaceae bacterium]|nr:DUF1080 domain-containing protein [Fimbriimonadaceae bacterium]